MEEIGDFLWVTWLHEPKMSVIYGTYTTEGEAKRMKPRDFQYSKFEIVRYRLDNEQ